MDRQAFAIEDVKQKVADYVRYLKEAYQIPVRAAYLYGSYAKGKAHAWSDIDVCIVSPIFSKEDGLSFLWAHRRKRDIDDMISPIGFAPEDLNSDDLSPLIAEIKKTGVLVPV